MTYLFDLDYQDPDSHFTVDAKIYGNVSHFVNHSVSMESLNLIFYEIFADILIFIVWLSEFIRFLLY